MARYPKMSLLVKAIHNFLGDASESCRHNARNCSTDLAAQVGGVQEYITIMQQYMHDKQVEDVCKHMGHEWQELLPPSVSSTPTKRTTSRSPVRHRASPSPAPQHPTALDASHLHHSLNSSVRHSPPSPMNDEIPSETHHTATPALSDLIPHPQRPAHRFDQDGVTLQCATVVSLQNPRIIPIINPKR